MLIGFYGENKTLAALLSTESDEYKIVIRQNPEGVKLIDEQAKLLGKDAFIYYVGFPARELKVFDLLKFMFNSCWKADYRTFSAATRSANWQAVWAVWASSRA